MPDIELLSRWRFWRRCWADAFRGAWGTYGTLGTVVGVALPGCAFLASRVPKAERGSVLNLFTSPLIPDLVWFLPLLGFIGVLAYRFFIVAPYDIYREEAARLSGTQADGSKPYISSEAVMRLVLDAEREKAARDAHGPKVVIERGQSDGRPLSYWHRNKPAAFAIASGVTPRFEFVNVGDESAFNVDATITIALTEYRIHLKAQTVAPGQRVAAEITLFKGNKRWTDTPAFDVERFAFIAHTDAISIRAAEEDRRVSADPETQWDAVLAYDVNALASKLPPKTRLEVEFDLTYVDFDRRVYRSPHVMSFRATTGTSGELTITISSTRPPTPVPPGPAPVAET